MLPLILRSEGTLRGVGAGANSGFIGNMSGDDSVLCFADVVLAIYGFAKVGRLSILTETRRSF